MGISLKNTDGVRASDEASHSSTRDSKELQRGSIATARDSVELIRAKSSPRFTPYQAPSLNERARKMLRPAAYALVAVACFGLAFGTGLGVVGAAGAVGTLLTVSLMSVFGSGFLGILSCFALLAAGVVAGVMSAKYSIKCYQDVKAADATAPETPPEARKSLLKRLLKASGADHVTGLAEGENPHSANDFKPRPRTEVGGAHRSSRYSVETYGSYASNGSSKSVGTMATTATSARPVSDGSTATVETTGTVKSISSTMTSNS